MRKSPPRRRVGKEHLPNTDYQIHTRLGWLESAVDLSESYFPDRTFHRLLIHTTWEGKKRTVGKLKAVYRANRRSWWGYSLTSSTMYGPYLTERSAMMGFYNESLTKERKLWGSPSPKSKHTYKAIPITEEHEYYS